MIPDNTVRFLEPQTFEDFNLVFPPDGGGPMRNPSFPFPLECSAIGANMLKVVERLEEEGRFGFRAPARREKGIVDDPTGDLFLSLENDPFARLPY